MTTEKQKLVPYWLIKVNTVINVNVLRREASNVAGHAISSKSVIEDLKSHAGDKNLKFVKLSERYCYILLNMDEVNEHKAMFAPSQYLKDILLHELKEFGLTDIHVTVMNDYLLPPREMMPELNKVFDITSLQHSVSEFFYENYKDNSKTYSTWDTVFNYADLNGCVCGHIASDGLCVMISNDDVDKSSIKLYADELDMRHLIGRKGSNISNIKNSLGLKYEANVNFIPINTNMYRI